MTRAQLDLGGPRRHDRRFARGRGSWPAVLPLVLGLAATGWAADHPTLVDAGTTDCATCHEDLLEVRTPHPPAVDDCLSCHSFARSEGGTTVALVEQGSALCLVCHDGLTPAAGGVLPVPHAPVMDDCGSCHDPHGTDQPALLVAAPEVLCLDCHDAEATDAQHPIPVQRGDCRSCHQAHGSENDHMLRGVSQHMPFTEGSCDACHRKPRGTRVRLLHEGGELCEACHGDMAGEAGRAGLHTALEQGRCTACHDPHLADRPGLLKADGGDLCFPCHATVAEAATGPGAHPILSEGCDSCHDPHSSERHALLVDDANELCRSCHDAADPELSGLHFNADMAATDCGSCHDPHGSRSMPLIARGSIHPPFREGCSNCHEGSAAVLQGGGGNDLCTVCHDDVAAATASAKVPHPAMEMVECIDCHSPHASRQPNLLRAAGGGVCLTCHEDQGGGEGDTVHGAIDWIGCQSCHLPHGGDSETLLREHGNDLCNGCHLQREVTFDRDGSARLKGGYGLNAERAGELGVIELDPTRQKDHPIPDHPVAGLISGRGRTEVAPSLVGKEMSCRLCHEPHSAPSTQLFAWQATTQTELCLACHPK